VSGAEPTAGKGQNRGLWRRLCRGGAEAVAIVVVATLFNMFDPFGLATATQSYTARVFLQIESPRYTGYENAARDNITVVLLTDTDLDILGETWPVGFDVHAEVLERILAHRPKSVMVDIGFLDDRNDPTLADFVSAIAPNSETAWTSPEDQTAVYLAAANPDPESPDREGILPTLASLAARDDRVNLVAVSGPERDHYALNYPITGGSASRLTAAVAMYLETVRPAYAPRGHSDDAVTAATDRIRGRVFDCLAAVHFTGDAHAARLGQPCPESNHVRPFEVIWYSMSGARVGEEYVNDTVMRCNPNLPETVPLRLLRFLGVNAGIIGGKDGARSLLNWCPPHRTMSVVELFRYDDNASAAQKVADEFFRDKPGDLFDHTITGKHVFYGAHVAMAADLIHPPTHSALPGVYLHSMALDNLLTFGGHVPFAEPAVASPLVAFGLRHMDLLVSFIVVAIHIAFAQAYGRWRTVDPVFPEGAMSVAEFHQTIVRRISKIILFFCVFAVVYMSVMFIVIHFMSGFLFDYLRITAGNIAGLFAIIVGLEVLRYRPLLEDAGGWFNKYLRGYEVSRKRQAQTADQQGAPSGAETKGEKTI